MFNFLYRLRGRKSSQDTQDLDSTTENALESSVRRIHAINPETDEQWRRLQNTLENKRSIGEQRAFIFWKIFLKPAFSFALACAFLVVVGVEWLRYSSSMIDETTKGQHSTITLQDRTEVTLNYLSELKDTPIGS